MNLPKTGLRVSWYIPFYILILSLFYNNFILQYFALALLILFFFIDSKSYLKKNFFFFFPFAFFLIGLASWIYNLFFGDTDLYALLFWSIGYAPNFILVWLVIACRNKIDFYRIYNFYKKLVYLQTFLLIYSAVKHGTYVVGDPATGTVGDANWVAFHICVVIIYEVIKLTIQSKHKLLSLKDKTLKLLEIIYFLIVFIIPESTANLGFMLIVIGLFFINEYFLNPFKIFRNIVLCAFLLSGFYFLSKTMVYERIEKAINSLAQKEIDSDPYLSKFSIYKKVLSGEISDDSNLLLGSGPATFTSRSSVVRMPDERINTFPIELPYFKSELFNKYISPIYAEWRESEVSYGNFASPQTTIISIAVELGVLGILIFFIYFYYILKSNRRTKYGFADYHLKKYVNYLTLYFVLSLFHLNFWEYPLVSFTYIIFVFSIIRPGAIKEKLIDYK